MKIGEGERPTKEIYIGKVGIGGRNVVYGEWGKEHAGRGN